MKILVVSQYFWPEPFIINQLVKTLADQGHEVTVFTGKPNYPDGAVYVGYSQRGLTEEAPFKSVKVYRVPLRPRHAANSFNLAMNYLSFVFSGIRYFPGFAKNVQADVILVFAPSPITSAIPAIMIKLLKRWHLAIWVQDLWPESLAATGHVRNRLVLASIGVLVKWIYRCADTLLIQSRAFRGSVERMADMEKIIYYPNSMQRPKPISCSSASLPEPLVQQLKSSFSIVFAGNLGKAQSLETILEAAKRLMDYPEIRFFLVGSGSQSDWLEEQKSKYSLDNVVMTGRYPMEAMPQIYAFADVLLVTLTSSDIFSLTVPSKIQAYLAAGKPIIAAIDGEGAEVVRDARAGLASPAEDVEAMVGSIRTLYAMSPQERAQLGKNGYEYFNQHFEMEGQAMNLTEILASRIQTATKGL